MSGPWERYAPAETGPWDKFKSPDPGITGDRLAQAFGGGATFNLGDELAAGVRAAAPEFSNWMMRGPALQRDESIGGSPTPQTVSTAPDFQGRYDEELAKERQKAKEFQANSPIAAGAANIAGSLATTALALPAAATAVGPSALVNVAKTAGVGAALGGAAGFGEGEGEADRLFKAGVGGVIGGGVGALTRPLSAIGRSIAESAPGRVVLDPVNGMVSALLNRAGNAKAAAQNIRPPEGGTSPYSVAEQGAAQRLATVLQRDRLTPEAVQAELARLGPEAIPSDVSASLLQQGVNAKTLSGETRQRAQDFFAPREGVGRIGRTGDRMVRAAEGDAKPPSHFALTGDNQEPYSFANNLRDVGARFYGEMDAAGLKQSPAMGALMENKYVNAAIDKVMANESATRVGTGRSPASTVDIMHKVKQEIADMGVAATGHGDSTQSYFRDLAGHFVSTLKAANPKLAAADRAYAEAASLPERYTAGASIFKRGMGEQATESSAPGIADLLQNSTAQQAAATRAGAINAVRDKAQTLTGARGLARDIAFGGGENGVQQSIRSALPNEAENLIRQSGTEGIFANTSNRYLGGPHTADDLVGASDLAGLTLRATPGGATPRWQESLAAAANWVASPNEAVRNQIGRMLLDANPETQRRTLALIAQILEQRSAGTPMAAGLAQAGGGLAGRELNAF